MAPAGAELADGGGERVDLTGPWFIGLVAALTGIAFCVTLVAWPRMSGRTLAAFLGRAGSLLGLNLLVLFTAALALNNQFTFFADWTDLMGALGDTRPVATAQGGGSPSAAAAVQVPGGLAPEISRSGSVSPVRQNLPIHPRPGQRVLRLTVTGAVSGITAPIMVELPAGYADPTNRGRRYPVLETFNGYPGDLSAWIGAMHLGGAVSTAVRQHRISDMIIVSPTLEVPPGRDTECVNSPRPSDPQMETWLTTDVPDWVARTFRTLPNRSAWATIGYSAGGWCAAMTAMLHPDRYSAAIVLGGYFTPEFGFAYRPFPAGSPFARRYDLLARARTNPPPVALWVQTSHADPISYPSAARLLAEARPPLSVTSMVLDHAGHRVSLWRGLIPQTLAWLGADIPGFRPAATTVAQAWGPSPG